MSAIPDKLRCFIHAKDVSSQALSSNWPLIAETMEGAAAEIERLHAELDIHIARRAESDAAWAISDKRTGHT